MITRRALFGLTVGAAAQAVAPRPFGKLQTSFGFNNPPYSNDHQENSGTSSPRIGRTKTLRKPAALVCLVMGMLWLVGFGICHGKLPPIAATWLLSFVSAAIGCFFLWVGFELLGPLI